MAEEHYDIVIVGGGIHGAGIAQAAAAYGFSVLVLEKNQIGEGTSSRSSKLIHGGLRYLETGQFSLVRECLRERDLLLKLAPQLVHLKPFYIPVYKDTSRSRWQLRLGLTLYAALNGFKASSRFSELSAAQRQQLHGLSSENLLTVFRYYDAQTDDQALTQSVMQSARQLGAKVRTQADFHAAEIKESCRIQYQCDAGFVRCSANMIINAAGPWVNQVLERVQPQIQPLAIDLVQGTHIVLNVAAFGDGIFYLEAPQDKRAVFAMPWCGKVMLGTTETTYSGAADEVKPLEQEVDYLLAVFKRYFPKYETVDFEILQQFAGLRVLPVSNESAFQRSRDTVIHVDNERQPRVVSVYGGKLTAYRLTAEKLLQRILPVLPKRERRAQTKSLALRSMV